ncbi:unnamed protein product [Triticum turgidum subsp. durum]|uniref:Uncharacterized protein n=1 Tax=Triticum turgidum subsp. durum TaxID=4567 RepID=A0A9R0T6X3_TRITD|nr:unnamed protein product [Triticum turgidum subsp. durum]
MLVSLSYSTLGHCFNSYNCFGNFSSCTLVLLLSNLIPTSPSGKLWVHLAGGELGRLVGSNSRDFLGSLIKPFGVKFPFLPVCRHHCLGRTDLSVPAQLWGRRVLQLADAGDGLMQRRHRDIAIIDLLKHRESFNWLHQEFYLLLIGDGPFPWWLRSQETRPR